MNSQYKSADAVEGIRQLVTELSNVDQQRKARGVLFYVHSLKSIRLFNPKFDPPGSVFLRRHADGTLGYTTDVPPHDPEQDHGVEVIRDQDEHLYFRENGQLLSPREFAAKLVALVAVETA